MDQDKELAAAAAGLDKALGARFDASVSLTTKGLGEDICKIYHDARPWLDRIAKVLDVIPIPWAGPLAKALRMLMTIADEFCPLK